MLHRNLHFILAILVGIVVVLASCVTSPTDEQLRELNDEITSRQLEVNKEVAELRAQERELYSLKDAYELETKRLSCEETENSANSGMMKTMYDDLRGFLKNQRTLFWDVRLRQDVDGVSPDAQKSSLKGWQLLVDLKHPVEKNCTLYGGKIFFNQRTPQNSGVYVVVLTPATKKKPKSTTALNAAMMETAGLDKENIDSANKFCIAKFKEYQLNYHVPAKDYSRQVLAPGQGLSTLVIRHSFPLKNNVNQISQATFISEQLENTQGKGLFEFTFSQPLTAFAGDYVGIIVPNGNVLAMTEDWNYDDSFFGDVSAISLDSLQECKRTGSELILDVSDNVRTMSTKSHVRGLVMLQGESLK